MDAHRRPPPKDALSDERARALALADVLRMEEAKQETQQWEPPRQTTAKAAVLATMLVGVAVWLWIWPPSYLSLDQTDFVAASDTRVKAALRVALSLQVDRIEGFRQENGRLPDGLVEVGEPIPGITYTRIDPRTFRLQARSGGEVVRFQSSDSLSVFIRNALETLRESNE